MTCNREDCEPVEQTRGELGPGDYYDVIATNSRYGGAMGSIPQPEQYGIPIRPNETGHIVCPDGVEPRHCVEITAMNENDFRICCKTCGKATPWGAKDIPGMPGAGADWTRKKWNEAANATNG